MLLGILFRIVFRFDNTCLERTWIRESSFNIEKGMKMFFFACWGWGRGAVKILGVWVREALKKSVR